MSYGIQVINNSNITIIDSDYSNYVVYSSGTVGGVNLGSAWDWGFYISIPPIVGAQLYIRDPSANGTFSVSNWGGTTPGATCEILGATLSSVLNYVIVVPSSAIGAPTGYGLNIYRGDGSLAFASQYTYMTLGGAVAFYSGSSGSITVPGNAYMCASLLTVNGFWAYNYNIYGDCSDPQKVEASGTSYLSCSQVGNNFQFSSTNTMLPPAPPCSSYEVFMNSLVVAPILIL